MRTHTRAIAPALPLVYALRLSWADPKFLSFAPGHSSRRSPSFAVAKAPTAVTTNIRQAGRSQPGGGLGLRPWTHASPQDVPAPQPRPPRVLESMRKDVGRDFPSGVSGESYLFCCLIEQRAYVAGSLRLKP